MGYYLSELQVNKPGVYAIINLEDMHIYIGKADSLRNRSYSHQYDLKKGCDNNIRLQNDYNAENKKLLFFRLKYAKTGQSLYFESLFCYVALESGFFDENTLFNDNKNTYPDKSGIYDYFHNKYSDYCRSEKAFNNDLRKCKIIFLSEILERFTNVKLEEGLLEELFESELVKCNNRKDLFEKYETEKYLKLRSGFFDFDKFEKNGIGTIDLEKIINNRVIFTKIGTYLDQDIAEILEEKIKDIVDNGYCFWALNKLNVETVRYFCTHDIDGNICKDDVYLIMKYTDSIPSEKKLIDFYKANNMEDYRKFDIVTSERFLIDDIKSMKEEAAKLDESEPSKILRMKMKNGEYYFPDTLKTKETCKRTNNFDYGKAFIIEKFYILNGNFREESLFEDYYSYTYNNYKKKGPLKDASATIKGQNDSACLLLKKDKNLEDIINKLKNDSLYVKQNCNNNEYEGLETNYIVAKLKKPFPIVKLKLDEPSKTKDNKRII